MVRTAAAVFAGAVLVTAAVLPAAAGRGDSAHAAAQASSGGAAKRAAGDLDGDGRSDLVVGLLHSIRVYYTSAKPGGSHLQTFALPDGEDPVSLATGDFNHDGFADLAVGSPFSLPDGPAGEEDGEVFIYYGSDAGLDPSNHVDFPGPAGKARSYGYDIQAADFNADGIGDLIVDDGVQYNPIRVLFGTHGGLTAAGSKTINGKDVNAIGIGDVNGDGHPDLVIGRPDLGKAKLQDHMVVGTEGVVSVYYGTAHGFAKKGHAVHGIKAGVRFGSLGQSLDVAKVNGDKYADVVVGAPNTSDPHHADETGRVAVFYGSKHGIKAKHDTVVGLGSKGVPGSAISGDDLGLPIVAADINGDGFADVAAGAQQNYNGRNGEVLIFRGSAKGLTTKHSQRLLPNALGGITPGGSDPYDFGNTIVALHPHGLKYASIAIGAPDYDPPGGADFRGFVDVYPGSKTGLKASGAKRIVGTVDHEFLGQALAP